MESPSTGLKSILSKARRKPTDESSILSSDTDTASIRESNPSFLEKIKAPLRKVQDTGDDSLKVTNLIAGVQKRRQKKYEAEGDDIKGRIAPEAGINAEASAQDGGSSDSLMTTDSEPEGITAPALVNRKSHIGYLTASSPSITTTPALNTSPSIAVSSKLSQSQSLDDDYSVRAVNILPSNASSNHSIVAPKPNHVITTGSVNADSTLSVDSAGSGKSTSSRSVSPGTKLKEAFKPNSKRTTNRESPERSNTIGTLFGKDRKASLNTRRMSKSSDVPPMLSPIPNLSISGTSNLKSVPRIESTESPSALRFEAPGTTVTPPSPAQPDDTSKSGNLAILTANGAVPPGSSSSLAASNSIHRRARSDAAVHPPSKLSQAMSVPMTPLDERTTASRSTSGNKDSSSSFFSSVFSAAQNAATTFSNSIGNNPARPRSSLGPILDVVDPSTDGPSESQVDESLHPAIQPKALAIDTIGTGDLSLSHLGISSDAVSSTAHSPSSNGQLDRGRSSTITERDESSARAESTAAARAVSAAYAGNGNGNERETRTTTPTAEEHLPFGRASSAYSQSVVATEDATHNSSIYEGENAALWRNGSLKSRMSKDKKRNQNGSGATGMSTIGAAISASHRTLMSPAKSASSPRITGFAVANKKRNRDFHQLFRSVPEDDYLIEDYSCALQRDIILAGRIYISEGHICFSSNILGWITTLIMSFDEVVSVEKESTAVVFPNAIAIKTLHARHTFRSLLSRETTYDLLIGIWKISHPSLQSTENGVRLINGGTGNKTEKVEPARSESGSEESAGGEVYDEDDADSEAGRASQDDRNGSIAGSENVDSPAKGAEVRKASAVPAPTDKSTMASQADSKSASNDFPGPATHAPAECTDASTHYDKLLKDEMIPAPLGKVFSMVFGSASGVFMTKWLQEEVKVMDLQMEADDKARLSEDNKSRSYSYIKPLYGAIGPKSTKCMITEVIDAYDLEKAVTITSTTLTPDVPSGNIFSTKTRYCLMWGPNNGTRLIITCTIEWTGKSWLKSAIEKGANDGQTTYANDLVKALRAGVSARPRASTANSKSKKGRKRKGDGDEVNVVVTSQIPDSLAKPQDWGMFEPAHGILGPAVDLLQPLWDAQVLVGILSFLLILGWFRGPRASSLDVGKPGGYKPGLGSAQRLAAYDEMWRGEESDLWDWLEERVGMTHGGAYPGDRGGSQGVQNGDGSKRARKDRSRALSGRKLEDMVQGMQEREVRHALETTEEKLKVLRGVVEGLKGERPHKEGEEDL